MPPDPEQVPDAQSSHDPVHGQLQTPYGDAGPDHVSYRSPYFPNLSEAPDTSQSQVVDFAQARSQSQHSNSNLQGLVQQQTPSNYPLERPNKRRRTTPPSFEQPERDREYFTPPADVSQYPVIYDESPYRSPYGSVASQSAVPPNASAASPSNYNRAAYGWQQGPSATGIQSSFNGENGRPHGGGAGFETHGGDDQGDYEGGDAHERGEEEVEGSDGDSDFLNVSDSSSDHDGELSDTDTLHRELDQVKMNYKKEVLKFRATRGQKFKRLATLKLPKRTGNKGYRKNAELTGDIKERLGRATQCWQEMNYSETRREANDIITSNAEIWQAYSLLALVYREWGQIDDELIALTSGCHFRPKDEAGREWLNTARRIDELESESRQNHIADGEYCCSQALKLLRHNVEALCLTGSFRREMNKVVTAIGNYKEALEHDPHNPRAMRGLAECYLDHDKPELAKQIYEDAIAYYHELGVQDNRFGWNEIAIYVELHGSTGSYVEAIRHLKMLSRWILGREEESYWDEIIEDDREFDTDELRRTDVPAYIPCKFDSLTYGDGLPLELRTKLGIYRLKLGNFDEAIMHFNFLENEAQFSEEDDLVALSDLFHEVADRLFEAGYHDDAVAYYQILSRIPVEEYFSHYLQMGKCLVQLEELERAEQAFLITLQFDEDNIDAHLELAKLYDIVDDKERAAELRGEVKALMKKKSDKINISGTERERPAKSLIARKDRKPYARKSARANPKAAHEKQLEDLRIADLRGCWETVRRCNSGLVAGDAEATTEWKAAASELFNEFKTCKFLYPYDKFYYAIYYKSYRSMGPRDSTIAKQEDNRKVAPDNGEGSGQNSKTGVQRKRPPMPSEHLGVPWDGWLDVLIQYAICLARDRKHEEAYKVCNAAKEAVVYCHVQDSMFSIYLCWCTCAVLANDMDAIVSNIRHFVKEYQFTTDAYRLFSALVRLCQSPLSHLTKGPTTKFILRNIKCMDYALVSPSVRAGPEYKSMASYTARDENGEPIVNKEMDVCLLLLYGHILYCNTSFGKALHYLFRAYSLDPDNKMINMTIGLCYIQYAVKRQTQYRPYVMMQGISFLQIYYDERKGSPLLELREEAHYNMARMYHMLGLTHLAIPFYLKCLREGEGEGRRGCEDLVVEAAYNLRAIYSGAGNAEMTRLVTRRWLVC